MKIINEGSLDIGWFFYLWIRLYGIFWIVGYVGGCLFGKLFK